MKKGEEASKPKRVRKNTKKRSNEKKQEKAVVQKGKQTQSEFYKVLVLKKHLIIIFLK